MYLIVGLGNPESKYLLTRHNMGFWVIDELSQLWRIPLGKTYAYGVYGQGQVGQEKVVLVKPTTYMNASGICVADLQRRLQVDDAHTLIIYDDMDLPQGKLRLRIRGGAGSHNGMKSVIAELQSEDFPRLRVGIGEPGEGQRGVNFVLEELQGEAAQQLSQACGRAAQVINTLVRRDVDTAMRQCNQDPKSKPQSEEEPK